MISPSMEFPMDELLAALDEQAELLDAKRSQLAELAKHLIARDDDATEKALAALESVEASQRGADMRLKAVRSAAAVSLGLGTNDLRLSWLAEQLPTEMAEPVMQRRQLIVRRAAALRGQHLQTVLHLAEAARLNRLLLESMFPTGESVVTYGARGSDHWRPGVGLVDTEL